jgi:hypothetical protein
MVQVLPSKEDKLRNVTVVKEEKDFSLIKNLISESPLVLATFTFYCFECISFDQLLITFASNSFLLFALMSRKSFEGSFIFYFTTSIDLVISFVMLKEGFKVISETKRNIQLFISSL